MCSQEMSGELHLSHNLKTYLAVLGSTQNCFSLSFSVLPLQSSPNWLSLS